MHLELDKKTNVVVEAVYVKSFVNTKYLLARLSKAERVLLDHITRVMDNDNVFVNDIRFRESFNQVFIDIGASTYTDSTISKGLSRLKKMTVIDQVPKRRGAYTVNPIYFVKGSESGERNTQRDKLVKSYMEKETYIRFLNRDNS